MEASGEVNFMYPQYPSFNPEGERILVRTLAETFSGERPGRRGLGLGKLLSALRRPRPQAPIDVEDCLPPCDDLSGAVPVAR